MKARPCANPQFPGKSFGSNAAAWWGFHYNDLLTEPKPREVITIYEIGQGVVRTYDMTALTLKALWRMISGQMSATNIGGPIQIAAEAGRQAREGLGSLALFTAIISVNLAVLNLLPVPMLDGGHLAFFVIEAVRGRPLSLRKREAAQQIGFVLLMLLMVYAFYNDLVRIDAFNALNHTNFSTPDRYVNTPQFGSITESAFDARTLASGSNAATSTSARPAWAYRRRSRATESMCCSACGRLNGRRCRVKEFRQISPPGPFVAPQRCYALHRREQGGSVAMTSLSLRRTLLAGGAAVGTSRLNWLAGR